MSSSSYYHRHNDEELDVSGAYHQHQDAASGVAPPEPPSWTFTDTHSNHNNPRLLSRDSSIHVTDEVFNSVSHLSAAMISFLGMVLLIAQSGGNAWKIVSFSVYGSSLLFLFSCSTLHHSINGTAEVRHIWMLIAHIFPWNHSQPIIVVFQNYCYGHRWSPNYACSTI